MRTHQPTITLVHIDPTQPESLHVQIYERLRHVISAGKLMPGMRLPSSRMLAVELRVSRNTVLSAYAQLIAEGYAGSRPGGGTYACPNIDMRELYRERQQVLLKAAAAELDGLVDLAPSDAGMHLVGRLLNGRTDLEISAAAARDGIDTVPLSIYYHDSAPQNGLLLGYTGVRPPLIWRGARDLASSMKRNG